MNVEEFLQDAFNDARHHFAIPEAQWTQPFGTYRAAQIGMTLLYFAAFLAFISGVWIWLFLPTVLAAAIPVAGLVGMGCAVSGLRVLGSDTDTKVLGQLSFDASFFMPFCICPSCNVEALHHMAAPSADAILKALKTYSDRCDRFAKDSRRWPDSYRMMVAPEPSTLAAIGLEFRGTPDVIRTCVDCSHRWGQRVGLVMPTVELPEADTPTLRAKAGNPWVMTLEEFKDKW